MAKAKKIDLTKDLAAVDATRKEIGPVTAKTVIQIAKRYGNVPTSGGIQRTLMALFFEAGAANKGEKYDVKTAYSAWADEYYSPSLAFPRERPKAKVFNDMRLAYQKFADLGALPYNSWPIAQRAMADRNLSLLGRAAKVEKMRAAHPETAPTSDEIVKAFTPKVAGERAKNIDAKLKALCSAIEKGVNDEAFMDALAENAVKSVRFRALAEAAMLLRVSVTKDDAKAKAEAANKALVAKLAALPTAGTKNGKALH